MSTSRMNDCGNKSNQRECAFAAKPKGRRPSAASYLRPVVAMAMASIFCCCAELPAAANDNNPDRPKSPRGTSIPVAGNDNITPSAESGQAVSKAATRGLPKIPASVRFKNPGAQYPAQWAKRFGMDGVGVIGGGHLIAHFPNAVAGAAANMYLLSRSYAGMSIGEAGTKWTGGNGFGVPGYDAGVVLTEDRLNDPAFMIPLMKAIAKREAGMISPLTDDEWAAAFAKFQSAK